MTKIQQALESLKTNPSYKILVEELRRWLNEAEGLVFDEKVRLEDKGPIITQRNVILNFINLPDNLINIEKLKEVSNTDSSQS